MGEGEKDMSSMVGKRFGSLVIVSEAERIGGPNRVVVLCDCGVTKETCARSVARGRTRSCGCLHRKATSTHGMSNHPEYGRWNAMVQRCHNPAWRNYSDYGGRGIFVCSEWRETPAEFINWFVSGGGSAGMQVDRIDNRDGYSPDNCRIVSPKDNARNRRGNVIIEVGGSKMTLADAADRFNIPYDRLYQRMYRLGWDAERAVR